MKYLSLFSGIGTGEKGIEQAFSNTELRQGIGREGSLSRHGEPNIVSKSDERQSAACIGFAEIDRHAEAIYRYHWPEARNYGDATRIVCDELPDFDFLIAGFPCQAFSIAGKREGFADVRGTLFFDIIRVLTAKRPMHALLENVKGLVSHDGGRTLEIILETLQEIGYYVNWEVYNSKDYGVPQNRERIFFICHNSDVLRDGHLTMTPCCVEIIKQWLFQTLLNNWDAVLSQQGIASKDWVLGLSVLKEILSAIGHRAKSSDLKIIWTNLFGNYVPCYQADLLAESPASGLNWGESLSIRDGILMAMAENRYVAQTDLDIWPSIELLLSSVWVESCPDESMFTTSTAIRQITGTKTYTFFQMCLLISSATVHLRNSFDHLWTEVLSDLTLIQEGMNYARVHKIEKGIAVTESGHAHILSIYQSPDTHFIVGHPRNGGCGQVFSVGDGDGNAYEPDGQRHDVAHTIITNDDKARGSYDIASTPDIAYALDANYHKGCNDITKGRRTIDDGAARVTVGTLRTHKDGQGFREMQGDVAPSLNARARQDGSQQGVIAIPVLTPDRAEKRQNGRRMKAEGEASFTLTAQDQHGVFNGSRIRRLTPTECERLQGLPDGFTKFGRYGNEIKEVSDTQRYKTLGNAMSVNVIEALITRMIGVGCLHPERKHHSDSTWSLETEMSEQSENIERVSDAIGKLVITFINSHMDKEFHVETLRQYIYQHVNGYVAPASPDRILRDLRQKGRVNYVVVNRSQSLYKALPVGGQIELFQ